MIQNKKRFWIRFALYVIFLLIIPLGFLIWKFNLFSTVSKLNIGGWGIIAIIFTAVCVNVLINEAVECVDSFLAKRVLLAIKKVLVPLLATTLCLYAVENFIKELIEFFIVLTLCEPTAYILNPIPEFLEEKKKNQEADDEEKEESKLIKFAEILWSRKK